MHKSQAGALPGVLPPLPCQRQGKALPHPFFSTAAKEEKVPRTDPGSIQEPGPTPGLQQPLGAGGSSPKPGPWSHRSPLPALCPHSLTFLTHSPPSLLPSPLPTSLGGSQKLPLQTPAAPGPFLPQLWGRFCTPGPQNKGCSCSGRSPDPAEGTSAAVPQP